MKNISMKAFATAMSALTLGGIATKASASDLPPPAPAPYYKAPAAVVFDDFSFFATEATINVGEGLALGTYRSSNSFSLQEHFNIYNSCGCFLDFDNIARSWSIKESYAKSALSEAGVGIGLAALDTVERRAFGSGPLALVGRGVVEGTLSGAAAYFLVKDKTSNEVQNWNFTIDQHPLLVNDVTQTTTRHNMKAVWTAAGLGAVSPAVSELAYGFVVRPTLGGASITWAHKFD